METHSLIRHPDTPAREITRVEARVVGIKEDWLRLRWRIEGVGKLVVPPFAGKGRADELWRTTCFEAFLQPIGSKAYVELNLSPSERWNAYDFTAYRQSVAERPLPREPECTLRMGQAMAIFDAAIPAAALPPLPWCYNLAAVLEEQGGAISYWALAHPPGKPDFHDPAGLVGELANGQ